MINFLKKLFMNQNDEIKTQLINRLISIQNRMETIWEFHPSNPSGLNPESEWDKLSKERQKVNKAIGNLYEEEEDDLG